MGNGSEAKTMAVAPKAARSSVESKLYGNSTTGVMGGLPGEVQHLQEGCGELETYCFSSGKKGLQWDITNSPRGNGT